MNKQELEKDRISLKIEICLVKKCVRPTCS